jgi:kumamolisin
MHGSVWEQMWRDRKPTPGRHNWVDEPPTDALPSRGPARPRPTPYVRESRVSQQPPITTGIRLPHAAGLSYTARQVAKAYNAPVDSYDGTGQKIGIVELGGGFTAADLVAAGLPNRVTVLGVDGGTSKPDGPGGADGEVELDIQVVAGVAPGADIRVYFAPNTDAGFIDATATAARECDVVSVSWGGPETQWSATSIRKFSAVLAAARAGGVPVFVAAGDAGSTDGTRGNVVDYPASDPSVIGCGGTRLTLDSSGQRTAEVTWNDDPTTSATGGGVSVRFPGRNVPDVAGNADPYTGYQIVTDGQRGVVGGTSAVAPLYAACYALLKQAYGRPFDFLNLCATNPSAMFDVTVGNNGGYKAGPGRDQVSGLGVADFGKLLGLLTSGTQIPTPGGGTTTPPASGELPGCTALLRSIADQITKFLAKG